MLPRSEPALGCGWPCRASVLRSALCLPGPLSSTLPSRLRHQTSAVPAPATNLPPHRNSSLPRPAPAPAYRLQPLSTQPPPSSQPSPSPTLPYSRSELSDLVKEVQPQARRPMARISFAFIYPDRRGKNVMRQVRGRARWLLEASRHPEGSSCSGQSGVRSVLLHALCAEDTARPHVLPPCLLSCRWARCTPRGWARTTRKRSSSSTSRCAAPAAGAWQPACCCSAGLPGFIRHVLRAGASMP